MFSSPFVIDEKSGSQEVDYPAQSLIGSLRACAPNYQAILPPLCMGEG